MRIPITVDSQGRTILGIFHVPPRRAEGSPLILLNYGLNGDRIDNHRLSVLLAERACAAGISVLRFDYAGCGVSEGEFHDASVASKTADAQAMIEFVKGCHQGEKFKLVLLGYSDGVRIVLNLLKSGEKIAAVGLWNPIVRSMSRTFKPSKKAKMAVEPTAKKLVFPIFGVYIGLNYLNEVNRDIDIQEVLDHPVPKLFVFGTGDVHTREFQKELKALHDRKPDFDLLEIEGANHLFNRTSWSQEVVDKTVSWVLGATRRVARASCP